jgi:hypothetical protein
MLFYLYADAKPSEAIQKHELPGLAVVCVMPHKVGEPILNVHVKQYKDYDSAQKSDRARRLTEWLDSKRDEGLAMAGFSLARSQKAAARYGLDLIEELPNIRVEPHYDSFRLYFDNEAIDFAQAVALVYYTFALWFAVLRAGLKVPPEHRNLIVFMDTFPGASPGKLRPGQHAPKTPGMRFIEFMRAQSKTAIEIDKENSKKAKIHYTYTTLEWWRPSKKGNWKEGKTHPHFTIVDWLAAAALAHEFKAEFVESYPNKRKAEETATALSKLYEAFKKFDIWSIADDNTLGYIVSNEKEWLIPDDAREFILSRAVG